MIRGESSESRAGTPGLRIAVGQQPALQLDVLSGTLAAAGFDVVCAETTGARLVRGVDATSPDVVLVHAGLDRIVPLAIVPSVRAAGPGIPVIALIDVLSPVLANAALAAEVDGVVLGSSSADELIDVVERVAAGEAVYPVGWLATAHRADRESIASLLSARQRDVLEALASGLDNGGIAERLQISRNTVKFHIRAIYDRLGVSNRVQASRLLDAERSAGGPRAPLAAVDPPARVGAGHPAEPSQTTRTAVSAARPRA